MKNIFYALTLMLALFQVAASAQTVTFTPSALEIVAPSASARTFYSIDEVFLIYQASTAKLEIKETGSNTRLWYGDTSSVTISGSTIWTSKLAKFALWYQEATTTNGYRFFFPHDEVGYRYRSSNGFLTVYDEDNKSIIYSQSIDSVKISGVTGASNKLAYLRGKKFLREFYNMRVGDTPTAAVGAAAGVGATVTIAGNATCGLITLTPAGTPTTTGVLATVTLPVTYPNKAVVTVTQYDSDSGAHVARWFVDSTANAFTLNASGTALSTTAYIFSYQVSGY